jgi:hypothetical protein
MLGKVIIIVVVIVVIVILIIIIEVIIIVMTLILAHIVYKPLLLILLLIIILFTALIFRNNLYMYYKNLEERVWVICHTDAPKYRDLVTPRFLIQRKSFSNHYSMFTLSKDTISIIISFFDQF